MEDVEIDNRNVKFSKKGNAKIKTDIKDGIQTNVLEFCDNEINNISTKSINLSLESGDVYINKVISDAGIALGMAVANISLVLDLEIVILGGVLSEFGEVLIESVRSVIENSLPFETIVRKSELGKKAGVYGLLVVAKETIMKGLIE